MATGSLYAGFIVCVAVLGTLVSCLYKAEEVQRWADVHMERAVRLCRYMQPVVKGGQNWDPTLHR
jgi:hypothetical protein